MPPTSDIVNKDSPIYSGSKTIALVAHDKKKPELLSWASRWEKKLRQLNIYATGTTGGLLKDLICLDVHCLKSGPLGGDQQIGALIAESKLDYLVFLWDPLSTQGHDNDVKALMRLAVVWNVPMACNLSSADFLISSAFLKSYCPKTYGAKLPVTDTGVEVGLEVKPDAKLALSSKKSERKIGLSESAANLTS